MAANLHGVWAKWERALEQTDALNKEVQTLAREPHPFAIIRETDRDSGKYVFRLHPAWQPGLPFRWGAIIGEIVHDLRSALDQLVWQLVILNGGTPDDRHSFPVCQEKPANGFGAEMRRKLTDRRGRERHGPLFGISDDALAVIEACQPYQGPDLVPLRRLHKLWITDKHQHLAPMHLVAVAPTLNISDGTLLSRTDSFDGDTYVVEAHIAGDEDVSGRALEPQVDMEPHAPTDIAFSEGVPVVEEFSATARLIMTRLLMPIGNLFPGESGIGFPHPERA